MTRRFVVRSGDGRTLSGLLDRAGVEATALTDGRVFVGRHRALDPNFELKDGDEVFVANPFDDSEKTVLLGRDGDLFAFLKPPGLPTIPDRRGNASLVRSAARDLGLDAADLHVVTRLDTNVSGVVILAKGGEATRRAASLQAQHALVRRYVGLSSCAPSPAAGTWDRPVLTKGSVRAASRAAKTAYAVVAEAHGSVEGRPALVAFRPLTGRTHQIRVHAAGATSPLLGDVAYGGPARVVLHTGVVLDVPRVALHACRVEIVSRKTVTWRIEAPDPEDLVLLWVQLGGSASTFDEARSLPMESAHA